MSMTTIVLDRCNVHVLSVIKGLKSEANTVSKAFDRVRPDKVAISLSKEEIEGLRNIPEDYEPELSRYEEIYADGLSKFGEVAAPPPCYVAALELAEHGKIPVVPVDMNEAEYSDLYCAVVPGTTLFRHSTRTWLLKRRSFSDDSPEAFVKAWDKAVNGLEAFRLIEDRRAESMAKGISEACKDSKDLLAIIELERADEVVSLLKKDVA